MNSHRSCIKLIFRDKKRALFGNLFILWYLYLHLAAIWHKQHLKIHNQVGGGVDGVLIHSKTLLLKSIIVSAVTMKRFWVHKENIHDSKHIKWLHLNFETICYIRKTNNGNCQIVRYFVRECNCNWKNKAWNGSSIPASAEQNTQK